MGGKAPKTPPAPDPRAVAAAQTGSNIGTSVANAWIGNANEDGPLGSVRYKQTGTKKIGDGTTVYSVPTFSRTTTLSPAQKKLLDQQNKIGAGLNELALSQTKRLSDTLGQPLNLDGLPDAPGPMNTNFDDYRGRVEAGLLERMNPQLERDYDSLENRLVNQGLMRGSQAFNEALDEHGRKANDARTQIFLASGNEARAAGAEERAAGSFNATTRERALQERMLMRQTPINEITALMNGGQVSMPQFTGYNAPQVAPTPVGEYMYKSHDAEVAAANQAAQARGQMFNTIGNIAGAGIFKWSDRRLKTDVEHVGWLPGVLPIKVYRYRYLGDATVHYGVMADEVPWAAVLMPNGYYAVNYGAL